MFKVMMKYDWHEGAEFRFVDLQSAATFMTKAYGAFKPKDADEELVFIIEKVKEDTEDAEAL